MVKETVRGPNYDYGFCEPYASSRYGNFTRFIEIKCIYSHIYSIHVWIIDQSSGSFGRPSVGFTVARAEVNTFQYKASAHDMPGAGYHSVGVEGPNARM